MPQESVKRIDVSDLSILTSVKIDSDERLRNWNILLQYLRTFCLNWEIVVVEQGQIPALEDQLIGGQVVHRFIQTSDAHYKTRNLNLAASHSSRKYMMMCDVDVIVPPAAIALALEKLRAGKEFIAPYNGVMVEIKREMITARPDLEKLVQQLPFFEKHYDRQTLIYERSGLMPLYGDSEYDSTGGALMFERYHFFKIGGWNTNMISYGFEDMEMLVRIEKLGYELERLDQFNCYHLEHARNTDSVYNNFYRTNEQEYERVSAMHKAELRAYVDNGFRKLNLDLKKDVEMTNDAQQYAIRVTNSIRYDLTDLSIVFVVKDLSQKKPTALIALCELLEKSFCNYDLVIVEIALHKYKYLKIKKHVRYFWINNSHSISEGIDLALSKVKRVFVSSKAASSQLKVLRFRISSSNCSKEPVWLPLFSLLPSDKHETTSL